MQEVGREKMTELEKILEEIKETAIFMQTTSGYGAMCVSTGAVERIIRKHMNDGWIPVEERLPGEEKEVLVTTDTGEITFGYLSDGEWHTDLEPDYPIAWRPLPDPYRPEKP